MKIDLVTRVAERHITAASTHQAGSNVLDHVLPVRDVLKLVDWMEDAQDKQSADLAREVYQKLSQRLRLEDAEDQALNRLKASVDRIASWDVPAQRNNIFKAANLLGIRLPSHIFASTKSAAKPPNSTPVPVTAVCTWPGAVKEEHHDVFLLPDTYGRGNGPVVVIENTGGRWYVRDFMKGRGRLAIDFGAEYYLENADEVRRAVRQVVNATAGGSTLEYGTHRDKVKAAADEATRAVNELQGSLTTLADWVRDHAGSSEDALRQASARMEGVLAEIHAVRRLMR
jgi:hypothetical protein